MRELVEHMARTLVENPDGVSVEETTQEDMTVYELRVEEADLGRVDFHLERFPQGIIVSQYLNETATYRPA